MKPTNPDAVRDAAAEEYVEHIWPHRSSTPADRMDSREGFIAGWSAALKQAPEVLRLAEALREISKSTYFASGEPTYEAAEAREALAEFERGRG